MACVAVVSLWGMKSPLWPTLNWNIGPIFRPDFTLHWLDFCLVAAIGGVWLFFFFTGLAGRALVPANDPYFKEALAHGGH